ncbi:MAG TPA: alpha/beta fold hydrolase [Immundisolibacter sp.]
MSAWDSRFIDVGGIRTHYLEAGRGPTLVLLHSGEFGGCAQLSWEHNIGAFAEHFRVIAPDWLGFGKTDKLYDFAQGHRRLLSHMADFLAAMRIDAADFVGNSMGGTFLARVAANPQPLFPIRRLVLASGGGFAPDNAARRALLGYDCTPDAMRALLRAVFHDPRFAADEAYVQRRLALTLEPGVWECTAAARFRSPAMGVPQEFGKADDIPYEQIAAPTLIVAGANDQLRLPGYAQELHQRIAGSRLLVLDDCGHCPNIEKAAQFSAAVIDFLTR